MYNEDKKAASCDGSHEEKEVCQDSYFAYLNEISRYKILTADEEVVLFQRIMDGDNVAKDLFIKSNLRLVVKEAKRLYKPGFNSLLDLIQEGNMGLLKAVERFDLSKGCKFSTYAVYLIRRAIQRTPSRYYLPLEIPRNSISLILKIKDAISTFERENGYKPSFEQLSTILNVDKDMVRSLTPYTNLINPNTSLNSKVREDEDNREVIDVFDEQYEEEPTDPEKLFIAKETKEGFRNIVKDVLNDKEIYILYSRWGLLNEPFKDVATLAKELNMSQQGIRQNEARSIEKLKQHLLSLNKSLTDLIQ